MNNSQPQRRSLSVTVSDFVVRMPQRSLAEIDLEVVALEKEDQMAGDTTNILRLVALKRLRNQLAPIHQLPPECFIDILIRSIDVFDWSVDRLQGLASVASTWRDVVLSTPKLWSCVEASSERRLTKLVLQKNPSAPLDVWCHSPSYTLSVPFFQDALPSRNRWRSLIVGMGPPDGPLQDLLANVDEDLPLRYVDLWNTVNFPWGSDHFGRLETLCLRRIAEPIETDWLLDTLSASPLLRKLVLTFITSTDIPFSEIYHERILKAPEDRDSVRLPYLRTLIVHEVPGSTIDDLLHYVDAPNCQCVSLERVHPAHFSQATGSSLFFNLIRKPLESSSTSVCLEWGGLYHEVIVSCGYPSEVGDKSFQPLERPGLRLRMPYVRSHHWDAIASFLHDSAPHARIIPKFQYSFFPLDDLILEGQPQELIDPQVILRDFDSIDTLQLNAYGEIAPLLEYLSKPQPDSKGVLRWPCPRLVAIVLGQYNYPGSKQMAKSFVKLARARSNPSLHVDDDVRLETMPRKICAMKAPRGVRKLLQETKEFSDVVFYGREGRWGFKGRAKDAWSRCVGFWDDVVVEFLEDHWPFN